MDVKLTDQQKRDVIEVTKLSLIAMAVLSGLVFPPILAYYASGWLLLLYIPIFSVMFAAGSYYENR